MATYLAETLTPTPVAEAVKDPKEAEVGYVGGSGPTLVYAPALVCYGRGVFYAGSACAFVASASLSGAASLAPGAASVSAEPVEYSGAGDTSLSQAHVGLDEVVCIGSGSAVLTQAFVAGAVAYAGESAVLLGGARLSASNTMLNGEGAVDTDAPVVLPKGSPGRATFTARPTASVVAWAVPR